MNWSIDVPVAASLPAVLADAADHLVEDRILVIGELERDALEIEMGLQDNKPTEDQR